MNNQQLKTGLRQMWEIRLFEQKLQDLYKEGLIHGTMHLCIGQEAVAVGAMMALNKSDLMLSNHRNHGHSLAKGMSFSAMFAEMLGKSLGTNSGKGGSMHFNDPDVGAISANGIVGGGFPLAAGVALACQMQQNNKIVICFAGDGAMNQGSFHEAMNLASIWKLPIIFVIENNRYAISSDIKQMVNINQLSNRAKGYGCVGITIDGNDLDLVYRTIKDNAQSVRSGESGPILVEAMTYRHVGHSKSDQMLYLDQDEHKNWIENNDPINRLTKLMLTQNIITETEIETLKKNIIEKIEFILNNLKNKPTPKLNEITTNVYAGKIGDLID